METDRSTVGSSTGAASALDLDPDPAPSPVPEPEPGPAITTRRAVDAADAAAAAADNDNDHNGTDAGGTVESPRHHGGAEAAASHISMGEPEEATTTAVVMGLDVAAATAGGSHAPRRGVSSGGSSCTGACTLNRPCAQQYVGKSQSCMVTSGRLIVRAPGQCFLRS